MLLTKTDLSAPNPLPFGSSAKSLISLVFSYDGSGASSLRAAHGLLLEGLPTWAVSYLLSPRFTNLIASLFGRGRAFTTAPVGRGLSFCYWAGDSPSWLSSCQGSVRITPFYVPCLPSLGIATLSGERIAAALKKRGASPASSFPVKFGSPNQNRKIWLGRMSRSQYLFNLVYNFSRYVLPTTVFNRRFSVSTQTSSEFFVLYALLY